MPFNPYKSSPTPMNLTLMINYDIDNTESSHLNVKCDKEYWGTYLNKSKHNQEMKKIISQKCDITYIRRVLPMYFEDLKRKRFTGFNVKWEFCCSGNNTSDKHIQDHPHNYNKLYMQIANVVHASNASKKDIMQLVRSTKVKHKDKLHAFNDRTTANELFQKTRI